MKFNDENDFFATKSCTNHMLSDIDSELKDLWKVSNFIKTKAQSDSKIVLDKNLAHLQQGLSSSLGERVVVDRREGGRRRNFDRRATFDSRGETNFFDKRSVEDRRQTERRNSNCYFVPGNIFDLLNQET